MALQRKTNKKTCSEVSFAPVPQSNQYIWPPFTRVTTAVSFFYSPKEFMHVHININISPLCIDKGYFTHCFVFFPHFMYLVFPKTVYRKVRSIFLPWQLQLHVVYSIGWMFYSKFNYSPIYGPYKVLHVLFL